MTQTDKTGPYKRIDRLSHSWPGVVFLYIMSIILTVWMAYCAKVNLNREHDWLMVLMTIFSIAAGVAGIVKATARAIKLKWADKS